MNFNFDCKNGHGDLHFINLRGCAGYGYDRHNKATNSCPPAKPWWDDDKYPDLEDFGGFYNPWGFPGYGPNVPMPISEVRPQEINNRFIEAYAGAIGNQFEYQPGYHYVPYWPYIAPDKPVEKEEDKCCCKKEWKCGDEWYYGRCNKK